MVAAIIVALVVGIFLALNYKKEDKSSKSADVNDKSTSGEGTNNDPTDPDNKTDYDPIDEEIEVETEIIKNEVEIKDDNKLKEIDKQLGNTLKILTHHYSFGTMELFSKNFEVKDGTSREIAGLIFDYYNDMGLMERLPDGKCFSIDGDKEGIIDDDVCNGDGDEGEFNTYLTRETLNKEYKRITGYDFSLSDDSFGDCPHPYYDKKQNRYYASYLCGGTGGFFEGHYIYKYTENDNYLYVYIAYGKKAYDGGDEVETVIINNENYEKFSKFRLYFEKKDGYYYFRKVALIER